MTTLTIEISEKAGKTLADLAVQLGGKVKIVESEKKMAKAAKKQQILADLEESVEWVKQYEQGKVKAKSFEQLLNEL